MDAETDGQANATADGDDVNAGAPIAGTCSANDDEDGVTFDNGLTVCEDADITVTASAPGLLNAFFDFNADGVYGAGEQVFNDEPLASGANNLTFNVPCAATPGSIYSRFRLSSGGGLGATGLALDGEVEDYRLLISPTDIDVCSVPMQFVSSANNNVRSAIKKPSLDWTCGQ